MMNKIRMLLGLAVLGFYFCINDYPIHSDEISDMQVHFIDVGQGDSILIKTPHNKHILIDGGPPEAGKKVVAYLRKHLVETIDLLIVTHPDIDHIGGLVAVLKQVNVERILDSGKLHTTRHYAKYIQQIQKQKIPVKIAEQDKKINIDPLLDIEVLNTYKQFRTNNQSSIALKVTYKKVDFLFMADVEIQQERQIMKKTKVDTEILKVAHHGSNTSTSLAFLREIKPNEAILTYSKNNHYGHPVKRVVKNLHKVKANIYSTAALGNIVIRTNGDTYLVIPEKEPLDSLYAS